jgi:hypothetical protein
MAVIEITPARLGVQVQAPPQARGGVNLGRAQAGLSLGRASGADPVAQAVGELGDTMGRLAEARLRAEEEAQRNTARAAALRAMAEAEVASNGDVADYRRRTGEAFRTIAEETFTLPGTRSRWLTRIQPEASAVEFRIQRTGAMRAGAEAASSREDALTAEATRGVFGTAEEFGAARLNGRRIIEDGLASGTLSPSQAQARLRRWDAELSEGYARRMLNENPRAAAEMLRDPAQLPGMTPVQRYRLMDRAMREGERAGGGMRSGGGARRAREAGEPLPVPPETPAEQLSAVEQEGDRLAVAADDADYQRVVIGERRVADAAQVATREAGLAWFQAAAGQQAEPAAVARFDAAPDLQPAAVVQAARAVALTGGAPADDGYALATLTGQAGQTDPAIFRTTAALAVADGRITPGSFVRLVQAAETAAADPAWARVRQRADETLTPPDLADLVPGLGDLPGLRTAALAELDGWRAQNPRAGAGPAEAVTAETVARAREAMVDALRARLPVPDGLPAGRAYAPAALDQAEDAVMAALDTGEVDEGEAARRLRVLDGWRWVAEALNPGEASR